VIHTIYSSLPTFKKLQFKQGLNILLADKTKASTSKDTRNGAGKSSVLEVIHFLLAGSCDKDSIFRNPALIDYSFSMEIDLGGHPVAIERTGSEPSEMMVVTDETGAWPVEPTEDKKTHERTIPTAKWDLVLGSLMFGLAAAGRGAREPYSPTFRGLFAYFARRAPGGFFEPHLTFQQGKSAIWQVAISYLLGLDWTVSRRWQSVRDEEQQLEALRKAVGDNVLGDIIGESAELRAAIAVSARKAEDLRARLAAFEVLPDYRAFEQEAAETTHEIEKLANENVVDEGQITSLSESLTNEVAPSFDDLGTLYREVGVILPDSVVKRFDEAKIFHESIIRNRRLYLQGELNAAKQRISQREIAKTRLAERQAVLLRLLQSTGALDHLTKLQSELGRIESESASLRHRYDAAQALESGMANLAIKRNTLFLLLQKDFREQRDTLQKAIVVFEEISARLYKKAARFTPQETANGPEFPIEIHADRSPGIRNMQIFTFDLMLMIILASRKTGPGVLIHDSHLFDAVDGRQVGAALSIASEMATRFGFQYIVTLNTDKVIEYPANFNPDAHILPVRLTDATDSGGLFGIRFQ
jgi:uncharacterized protein YydD (DUF2326 family)